MYVLCMSILFAFTNRHVTSYMQIFSCTDTLQIFNYTAVLTVCTQTAGQERFHSLGPIYYRDAKGAILVYDITDISSFQRMKSWAKELRKMVGDSSKICLFIVGNKLDLERNQRAVSNELAKKYADSVGADFLEVSAKTGYSIDNIFVGLTKGESYFF
ncbi:hypothetical protein ACHAXS_007343 [Conticribra weissflogii]